MADSLKDFCREGERLADLCRISPHIVNVNEMFRANGTGYYVMEFVDGLSLYAYLQQHGPLSEKEVENLLGPIVQAMALLHEKQTTHLDIKPGNIMLSRSNNGNLFPILIDFGLAKHYDKEGTPTSTVNVMGASPAYAPPEQYSGIRTFSPQSDIYALGATILNCLTGKVPPESTDWPKGEPLGTINRLKVSQRLKDLLAKALQNYRYDRYDNASAMLRAWGVRPDTTPSESAGPQDDSRYWQGRLTPFNLSLCVTRQGHGDRCYYLSAKDWRELPAPRRKGLAKKGLFIGKSSGGFLLGLNEDRMANAWWGALVQKCGKTLPTREQLNEMLLQTDAINAALTAFGAQPLGVSWKDWEDNDLPIYAGGTADNTILGSCMGTFAFFGPPKVLFTSVGVPAVRIRTVKEIAFDPGPYSGNDFVPDSGTTTLNPEDYGKSAKSEYGTLRPVPHATGELAVVHTYGGNASALQFCLPEAWVSLMMSSVAGGYELRGIYVHDSKGGFILRPQDDETPNSFDTLKPDNTLWKVPGRAEAETLCREAAKINDALQATGSSLLQGWYLTREKVTDTHCLIFNPSDCAMLNVKRNFRYQVRRIRRL